MKGAWDQVKLRRLWWDGPEPQVGDELQTSTRRRYLILNVRGATLECLVLPRDAPVGKGEVFDWQWGPRHASR